MRAGSWVLVIATIIGCGTSSISSSGPGDSGAPTPPPAPPPVEPSDAASPADASDAADAADASDAADANDSATVCPSSVPVVASDLPWKPPTATQTGKCSEALITLMQQYAAANPGATDEQTEAYLKSQSATCHDCVYSNADAGTWGPLPLDGTKVVTQNVGACFALKAANEPCGKAIQNEYDCERVACASCPDAGPDGGTLTACKLMSQTSVCKPFIQTIQSACAGVSPTVDDACGSLYDTIRVQCVAP